MSRLRSKATTVVSALILAALLFGAASMVWFNVTVPNPVQDIEVAVRGTTSTPAVPALALVAAAAALALTIAGPRVRWLVAAAIPASAVGAGFAVVNAAIHPEQAAESAVGETAGVIGTQSAHAVTFWPWSALALSVLLTLVGVWILLNLRGWSTAKGNKYERHRGVQDVTEADRPSTHREHGGGNPVHDPDAARRDGIDTWDALSEGDDPTGR